MESSLVLKTFWEDEERPGAGVNGKRVDENQASRRRTAHPAGSFSPGAKSSGDLDAGGRRRMKPVVCRALPDRKYDPDAAVWELTRGDGDQVW